MHLSDMYSLSAIHPLPHKFLHPDKQALPFDYTSYFLPWKYTFLCGIPDIILQPTTEDIYCLLSLYRVSRKNQVLWTFLFSDIPEFPAPYASDFPVPLSTDRRHHRQIRNCREPHHSDLSDCNVPIRLSSGSDSDTRYKS